MKALSILFASVLVGLIAAPNCAAESEPLKSGWKRDPGKIYFVDSADPGKKHDQRAMVFSVVTNSPNGARLRISCQVTEEGHFSLASGLELDPAKAKAAEPKRTVRPQKRTVKLFIDGTETPISALYNAHKSILMPTQKSVSKTLFNAVVQAQPIAITMQGKSIAIANPGPDAVFETFAQECPVSNGGQVTDDVLARIKDYSHPVLGK